MDPQFTVMIHVARPVAEVFDAVTDPAKLSAYFTTGGASARLESGTTVTWDFHDFPGAFPVDVVEVVPNERIVYSYEIHLDATRISVSLTTVEFRATATGCSLLLTEQDVFLDGYDGVADRERGTRELLDKLDRELQRAA